VGGFMAGLEDQYETFKFSSASHPQNAIALVYDLEGFSNFFNQPDVQEYIPAFLNIISESVSTCLFGGTAYWQDNAKYPPLSSTPIHEKFMGDGGLYIFTPDGLTDFREGFPVTLCNRLYMLRKNFHHVVQKCTDTVPVFGIPKKIRFGLARGSVYELSSHHGAQSEYIGFCINLSSRLQAYCPELGFIVSARLKIPAERLSDSGYKKVIATKIKGFPKELVFVDGDEYQKLSDDIRNNLFEEID
jgi:class 3 adenylate cyclase